MGSKIGYLAVFSSFANKSQIYLIFHFPILFFCLFCGGSVSVGLTLFIKYLFVHRNKCMSSFIYYGNYLFDLPYFFPKC